VEAKRTIAVISVLLVFCAISVAAWQSSPWWPQGAPKDFEECSEQAVAPSEDERKSLVAECDKRFVGRRKIGGGYTYYDFLQNRHFDIDGPNPSPKELKFFDEQYTSYLDTQRRDAIAAELSEKDDQRPQTALGNDQKMDAAPPPGPPLQITPTNIPVPIARSAVIRPKDLCHESSFSCGWARFSSGVKDFFQTNAMARRF
jgi:hypothetical protein